MHETITAIVPYYKNAKYFKKCFFSILNQTYKVNEIIIICDEPTNEAYSFLKAIVKNYKKSKIIFNKKNKGVAFCRNLAILKSKSKYIAFLDSDDYWNKNKLKIQIAFMKKNNLDISHTSYKILNSKGHFTRKFNVKSVLTFNDLLSRCDIGTSTVLVKKSLVKKYKFPSLKNQEDYLVWLNISKIRNIYGLDRYLTCWRNRRNSLSTYIFLKLKNSFKIYNKYLRFGKIYSVFRVIVLVFNNIEKKFKINF